MLRVEHPEYHRQLFWQICCIVLLSFACFYGSTLLLDPLLTHWTLAPRLFVLQSLASLAGLGCLALSTKFLLSKPPGLYWQNTLRCRFVWFIIALGLGLVLSGLTWFLEYLGHFQQASAWAAQLLGLNSILIYVLVIVIAPLFEELVFRGWLYNAWLAAGVNPYIIVLLTALAWSALHWQYDLMAQLYILFIGLLLGMCRLRSGSYLPSLMFHVVFNAVQALYWWLVLG